jgi:hypothetical protein
MPRKDKIMAGKEYNLYTPGDENPWDDTIDYYFTSHDHAAAETGSLVTGTEVALNLLAAEGQRIVERSYGDQGHLD